MLTGLKRLLKRSKKLYLKLGPVFATYRNSVISLSRGLGGINYNEVVFSSFNHQAYNDNPRYRSEALHALRPQTEIVWLFAYPENAKKYDRIIKQFWRDVRAVECARLESGYALTGHRRFKSCSLRH